MEAVGGRQCGRGSGRWRGEGRREEAGGRGAPGRQGFLRWDPPGISSASQAAPLIFPQTPGREKRTACHLPQPDHLPAALPGGCGASPSAGQGCRHLAPTVTQEPSSLLQARPVSVHLSCQATVLLQVLKFIKNRESWRWIFLLNCRRGGQVFYFPTPCVSFLVLSPLGFTQRAFAFCSFVRAQTGALVGASFHRGPVLQRVPWT